MSRPIVRIRVLLGSCIVALLVGAASVGSAVAGDVRVTEDSEGSYVRDDGGSDQVLDTCGTSRRVQVEPTVAVDPRDPDIVVAGAIDRCYDATVVDHSGWVGYYRSSDGGETWHDSLVPGYIGDDSPEGLDSPAHGSGFCSDPTQSFDGAGRLFYAFICGSPVQSLLVATYEEDGASYARTVLVASGTPTPDRQGPVQDKPNLVVDQSNGPGGGNVYVAWTRRASFDEQVVLFARSTDRGHSFSVPRPVAAGPTEGMFTDLAVGPDGAVSLVWRSGAIGIHDSQAGTHAIWLARSTDLGRSFGKPQLVQTIIPFDSRQFSGFGGGFEGFACGLLSPCPSGLTFAVFTSSPAVAADATGVHVVWSAERADGQAKIFVRNSPDGAAFSTPERQLDSVPAGHQWFPDLASADGILTAVFYDSRSDPAYSPDLPPGDTADGLSSGDVVDAWSASSGDGGQTWTEQRASEVSSTPNWNQGRTPFFGDYIYASAVPGGASAVWTDSRDVVPGIPEIFLPFFPCDPTDPTLLQSDPCFSAGGLDDNIYARRLR